ncbi:hypothetical protein SODG_000170 [Sodalis praecaptivus]
MFDEPYCCVSKKLGITQASLAEKLGWNQSRIANYESGKRLPNLNVCHEIVRLFNEEGLSCSVDSLFPPKPEMVFPQTDLPNSVDDEEDDDDEGDIDLTKYYNV